MLRDIFLNTWAQLLQSAGQSFHAPGNFYTTAWIRLIVDISLSERYSLGNRLQLQVHGGPSAFKVKYKSNMS